MAVVGDGGADGEMLSEEYALVEKDSPAAGFAFAGEGVDDTHPCPSRGGTHPCPSRREGFYYWAAKHSPGVSSGVYSGGVSALFFIALH